MEPASLERKVVLITGGSRGMGRAMAIGCARAGAAGIVITAAAASDETPEEIRQELAEVVGEIRRAGGRGLTLEADVTSPSDCEMAVARTLAEFDTVDVLINNAGKSQRYHGKRGDRFWQADPGGWRLVMETNVVGPFLMTRAAVPHMLERGWGRIINVTKNADSMHEPFTGAYGCSKAALEAASLCWAEELAGSGVTVNTVSPGGGVNTRFGVSTAPGRLSPEIIVPLALWLASLQSDGYSGCRFEAKLWDPTLPNAQAAELCRGGPLFPPPAKQRKLERAWQPPRSGLPQA